MDVNCEGHIEADTKFALFLSKLEGPKNIVVRCADTDILVINLANIINFDRNLRIWLQFGSGNNCRFINITEIHKALGNLLCSALPAFNAITGSDFTPALYKKGKSKPFSILRSTEKYQSAFRDLADPTLLESCKGTIEEFVCKMYSTKKNQVKNIKKVNEARCRIFVQHYGMIDDMEQFKKKVVTFDASHLPPCLRELEQQILRTVYVSHMWTDSHKNIPSVLDPTKYGWKLSDEDEYTFNWFEGPETPDSINEIVISPETPLGEDDENDESCNSDDDDDDDLQSDVSVLDNGDTM
ncbi:hypothetical protein NQ315_014865 [Exocentrus adspersus]|uniref:Uncharacterized protein n=1 Tax=Exocentrus adspersus TaxID=1586481 RepID=A0AAV8VKM7_9CUCU|nr:hypothetical protein NQ315_014865 [Exocentrus adspersus]